MKPTQLLVASFFFSATLFVPTLSLPLPPPPDTPPPDNQTKPGGGLDPEKNVCHQSDNQEKSLTALIPIKNPVLTTSSHPTILIYIPDQPQAILKGEFWINSPDGKTRLNKKIHFTFRSTPGIISITLPNLPNNSLEKNQFYSWYFKLYCNDNTPNQPDLAVKGWVRRIPMTPESQKLIEAGKPDIWYDTLTTIYQRLNQSPNDSTLRGKWSFLLQMIDAQELANEPIKSFIIPIEN